MVWFGFMIWHINHHRLFNAKSIFIHINNSTSNNSVKYMCSLNVKNISISNYSDQSTKLNVSKYCYVSLKIQLNIYIHLNVKSVLFQTYQFSRRIQFCYIWPIDRILSGATTLGLSGHESAGNERVLCIPCLLAGIGWSVFSWKSQKSFIFLDRKLETI